MIVCHCNVLTDADIRDVVAELLSVDPYRVLTPGLVYMTLGKRGRCCGCFPHAIDVISRAADAFGACFSSEEPETEDVAARTAA